MLEQLTVLGTTARSELITRGTPISIGIALVLIGGVYMYATGIQEVRTQTRQNRQQIQQLDAQQVPRKELNNRLDSIRQNQDNIQSNQQEILRRLRQ